jgi:transposase
METKTQQELGLYCPCPIDGVEVNRRVWYRDLDGMRAVFVDRTPFYVLERNDEVQYRFCAVQLVDAELASASEVYKAFGISQRTFSRIRQLVRKGGIAALVKEPKAAQGRQAKTQQNTSAIVRLYQEGKSTYEITSLLGISPRTVGRVLKDEGIPRRGNHGKSSQPLFANSQVVESETVLDSDDIRTPVAALDESREDEEAKHDLAEKTIRQTFAAVDEVQDPAPISSSVHAPATPVQATSIPYASPLDRACLRMGLIEEAPVEFESACSVAGAGTLLGLALLGENGLLEEARGVYGRLQKCWYGLRPLIWQLLVMAWLRIKSPEQIKSHDPGDLGRLLGLPRAAEGKTSRRKLQEIAERCEAAELHRRMAKRRAEEHDDELFRLYVDGHVRVYYGQRRIGKAYVTRLNSRQRAETDYWVHLSSGHPLLVVRDAANESFTQVMREQVLPEIRSVIGARRVRIVFDRAGWSKELFQLLLDEGFDLMTYRCHPYAPLDESEFQTVKLDVAGQSVTYELAESTFEEEGWPPLRLIAVKRKDGGQTHLVASGYATWQRMEKEAEGSEPAAEELAWGMFGRWCQENWFKYMMSEYSLDVLLEYTSEPDDPEREVPNPVWRKLDQEVAAARKSLQQSQAKYAKLMLKQKAEASQRTDGDGVEGEREKKGCGSCGKCLACRLLAAEREITTLEPQYQDLLRRRRETPKRTRLGDVSERDAVKLSYEEKLFSDTVKLSAYEIETRLHGLLRGHLERHQEEGRGLLRSIFAARGDLRVEGHVLEVHLEQLSSPRYTEAMISLCAELNALDRPLVETDHRLRFYVKPRPVGE